MMHDYEKIVKGINRLILSDKLNGDEVDILKLARRCIADCSKVDLLLESRLKRAEEKIESIKSDRQRGIDSDVTVKSVGKVLLRKVRSGKRLCINCDNLHKFPAGVQNRTHKLGICSLYNVEVLDYISYCKEIDK